MKRVLKKLGLGLLALILILVVVYLLGPTPDTPQLATKLPTIDTPLTQLDQLIANKEKQVTDLRPDNESRIIWADTTQKTPTEYAIVYLHGFSASWMEGEPVHRRFAQRFGCNLYLPRLAKHGIGNQDAFLDLTEDALYNSAKEAVAIGKKLGKKVIIMATSTGGLLGLHIAAHHPEIAALILYSPLIRLYPSATQLLDKPWGLQIARLALGDDYYDFTKTSNQLKQQYWTTRYRLEATVMLQNLVMNSMTEEIFKKVKQPLFLGYYYKDEANQDKTVSVAAMKQMFAQISTPAQQKQMVAFPKAGAHVIASKLTSKDYQKVLDETEKFAKNVLKLKED
ncbi:MAG TPA: alpha/beta hydrolase [Microscillaceae bacterium]|nr:alpha/beta hydrolase [Microscillaceae bacterium]